MLFKIAVAFALYVTIGVYGWEFLILLGAAIVGVLTKKALEDD